MVVGNSSSLVAEIGNKPTSIGSSFQVNCGNKLSSSLMPQAKTSQFSHFTQQPSSSIRSGFVLNNRSVPSFLFLTIHISIKHIIGGIPTPFLFRNNVKMNPTIDINQGLPHVSHRRETPAIMVLVTLINQPQIKIIRYLFHN